MAVGELQERRRESHEPLCVAHDVVTVAVRVHRPLELMELPLLIWWY